MNKIQKIFLLFLMYSIIGWCYEVFLEVVIYHWGFTNRGVLFGPYCPVYGFGSLLFIFCFYKNIKQNDNINKFLKIFLIFLGCMIVATLIELMASYILEYFTGHWLWETYKNYKYNFQGRIALSTSIRFGLGGIIFLYFLQPIFSKIFEKIGNKTLNIISIITLMIFLSDCIYTFFIK